MTAPRIAAYLFKDLQRTIGNLKTYIKKMESKLIGKIIYTDTLFKFNNNNENKIMKKAYNLGLRKIK